LTPDPIYDRVKSPEKAGTLSYRIAIRKGPLSDNPDLLHEDEVDELDDAELSRQRESKLGVTLPAAEDWVW
jgi:hypothetical protein